MFRSRISWLVAAMVLLLPWGAKAQLRGVTAMVTPIVEGEVAVGGTLRGALTVVLPDGFHVQSNTPRDPSLIPTVLTLDAPPGVSIAEIVFPTAIDVKLA